ncbi:MAG: hypothetical protein AAF411_30540 [Myxococcota bacterium]
MAKKSEKQRRKAERKAQKDAEKAARAAAEEAFRLRQEKHKRALIAIPLITGALALGLVFGLGESQLAGIVGLCGGLLFLMIGLSSLGGSVQPRDRMKAGSIDFGASKDR